MIQKNNTNNEPSVRVYALGGLDETGKNMYCIETPDSIFVIEAGSKYPDLTNPGVDIIIPDMTYLKEHASKVKAIIISHGHDDEYGALPYLLNNVKVPIYTTETTRIIIMADFGKRFGKDYFDFHIIKPSDDVSISGYRFHFFETTHAVMESFGFSIETPSGSIVYTGDYISDFGVQGHFSFNLNKIAKIADEHSTLLMLCESSASGKPGIASPTHKITPHIKSLIEEGEHRLIIACYSQNLYAINEIINLAIANHKRLVITNEHFLDIIPQFIANGDFIIPRANQCGVDEIPSYAPTDLIILVTGQGEELYNTLEDIGRGENKHKALAIKTDDIIVLACPSVPMTETKEVEAIDSLYKTGAKIINLSRHELSSMHAQEEDIKMMVSLFHPKYFMPIEGEFRELMANAKLGLSLGYNQNNIFLVDNGMSIGFDAAGNFVRVDQAYATVGNTFIDGLKVGDVRSDTIEERQKLSNDGVIVLGATISSLQHKIIGEEDIQMRGFLTPSDSESTVKEIKQIFHAALVELASSPKVNIDAAASRLADTLAKEMQHATNKNPLICPMIVDIDSIKK